MVYIDGTALEGRGIALMLIKDGKSETVTQTGIRWEEKRKKESLLEEELLFAEYLDIFPVWEGEKRPSFYGVPMLCVFARDSQGGYFVTMETSATVYYLTRDRKLYELAENSRELLRMAIYEPDWKTEIADMEQKTKDLSPILQWAEKMELTPPKTEMKKQIMPVTDVQIFSSREEAEKEFEICDWSELEQEIERERAKKLVYYDGETQEKAPIIEECNVFPAGKRFDPFVMTCEENGFTSLQRKRGIFLIFEGNIPKVDLYPVPQLTLFAKDEEGGFFAHAGSMDSPIYYISVEHGCWYLAPEFRTFVQMVVFEPEWKERITGEKAERNETEEELAALGRQFGFSGKTENFAEKVHREPAFEIFENIEKAREKMSLLSG